MDELAIEAEFEKFIDYFNFEKKGFEYFRNLSVTDRGKKILFILTNSIVKVLLVFRII